MRGVKIYQEDGIIKIKEVVIKDVLKDLYREIKCHCVTVASYEHHDLWIDDNGIYEQPYSLRIGPYELFGPIIILESDDNGNTIGTDIPLDEVKKWV